MKIISLTKEDREKAMLSECEGLLLMLLHDMDNGMRSTDLKDSVMKALNADTDDLEEGFESLREEALIRYDKATQRWHITEDGKNLIKEIATFEENLGEDLGED
jgi:predicted transcriptional regulator